MIDIPVLPLTKAAFAAFGEVLEADPTKKIVINGGTTERFHAIGKPVVSGGNANVIMSIFRSQPRSFPFIISMMERHPLGSQSFTPLSGQRFLVVVAPDEAGCPGIPEAFLADADQGVNYHSNVWHHPLIAMGEVSDFLVVDREGPGTNCEEYELGKRYRILTPR